MLIYKVLKRKDAMSVIIAVVIAFALMQTLSVWSIDITSQITNSQGMYGGGLGGWENQYLNPAVSFAVQLVMLEVVLWIWVGLLTVGRSLTSQKSSKK